MYLVCPSSPSLSPSPSLLPSHTSLYPSQLTTQVFNDAVKAAVQYRANPPTDYVEEVMTTLEYFDEKEKLEQIEKEKKGEEGEESEST